MKARKCWNIRGNRLIPITSSFYFLLFLILTIFSLKKLQIFTAMSPSPHLFVILIFPNTSFVANTLFVPSSIPSYNCILLGVLSFQEYYLSLTVSSLLRFLLSSRKSLVYQTEVGLGLHVFFLTGQCLSMISVSTSW